MSEFHLDKKLLKTIKSMAKEYRHNSICSGCPLEPLRHKHKKLSCRQLLISISNYSSKHLTAEGVDKTIEYNRSRKGTSGCVTINRFFLANMDFCQRSIKI